MMAFERFTNPTKWRRHGGRPYISFITHKGKYKYRRFYINASFLNEFNVEEKQWAELFYDSKTKKVGIKFHSSQSDFSYCKVSVKKGKKNKCYWGVLTVTSFIHWINRDFENKTIFFVEKVDDDGIISLKEADND